MADEIVVTAHPRLYLGSRQIDRLAHGQTPWLGEAQAVVAREAEAFALSPVIEIDLNVHNAHCLRARTMQGHVVTLLTRWKQTGEERYRQAALAHLWEMERWEHWGWESWRRNDPRPVAEFDLSYGENAATVAIAYDWLADTLSEDDSSRIIGMANQWIVAPFLKHAGSSEGRAWWFGLAHSNWNSVCVGGAGMAALAMWERIPQAGQILSLVDQSLTPFMRTLQTTAGGWPEGLGYWNYGMRYAFMYLLSWESATGRTHPLMLQNGTRQTLWFPLDFCPNGVPCSFGDVPRWQPHPFHFAAAERFGDWSLVRRLDDYMRDWKPSADARWPEAAELLLLHPDPPKTSGNVPDDQRHVVKVYPTLDWAVLADRLPGPRMYLAVRGGTTRVPHSHMDLLSFFALVGDEALLSNLVNAEYMDTTFSSRRWEIFETTPPAKNTLLVNGVGITSDSTVNLGTISGDGWKGLLLDATQAMGLSRDQAPAVDFYGRLFVMIEDRGFVVLDRVILPHPGRVETRVHTWHQVELRPTAALIRGQRQQMRLAWACDVPAVLCRNELAMTCPVEKNPTTLRWCTRNVTHTAVTMAMLMTPGAQSSGLALSHDTDRITLTVQGDGWSTTLRFDQQLLPVHSPQGSSDSQSR